MTETTVNRFCMIEYGVLVKTFALSRTSASNRNIMFSLDDSTLWAMRMFTPMSSRFSSWVGVPFSLEATCFFPKKFVARDLSARPEVRESLR